jgi:hypothetical protein
VASIPEDDDYVDDDNAEQSSTAFDDIGGKGKKRKTKGGRADNTKWSRDHGLELLRAGAPRAIAFSPAESQCPTVRANFDSLHTHGKKMAAWTKLKADLVVHDDFYSLSEQALKDELARILSTQKALEKKYESGGEKLDDEYRQLAVEIMQLQEELETVRHLIAVFHVIHCLQRKDAKDEKKKAKDEKLRAEGAELIEQAMGQAKRKREYERDEGGESDGDEGAQAQQQRKKKRRRITAQELQEPLLRCGPIFIRLFTSYRAMAERAQASASATARYYELEERRLALEEKKAEQAAATNQLLVQQLFWVMNMRGGPQPTAPAGQLMGGMPGMPLMMPPPTGMPPMMPMMPPFYTPQFPNTSDVPPQL